MQFILYVDYGLCITWIIHQQLWGYEVEEELHLGVHKQKMLNTTAIAHPYWYMDGWMGGSMDVCMDTRLRFFH
jgi:hypothetical protein